MEDIAAGRIVIVTDDERRENEGDLIMAASKVTDEAIGIMIRHCSGIVCVATTSEVLLRLGLAPMVANNRDKHRTDFAVSVDAAKGVTTGISASDRAETIRVLGNPESVPATSSPCAPGRGGSWSAQATPRRRSIWRCSRASIPAASCAN